MLALRYVTGIGYSSGAPSEFQVVVSTVKSGKPPLIYCHGAGDTATTVFGKAGQINLVRALAQHYTVIVADLGLQAWGNDTHIARVGDAINYLANTGLTEPPTLLAVSMGNLGAFGYARTNNVKAVAGVIPALDLADLYARGFSTDINSAYPGGYDDEVHGPTHSPVRYADSIASPVHLFTASNDTMTVPATADAFIAKRPSTGRTDLGALGHTEAAINAAVTPVMKWLASTRL